MFCVISPCWWVSVRKIMCVACCACSKLTGHIIRFLYLFQGKSLFSFHIDEYRRIPSFRTSADPSKSRFKMKVIYTCSWAASSYVATLRIWFERCQWWWKAAERGIQPKYQRSLLVLRLGYNNQELFHFVDILYIYICVIYNIICIQ